MGVYKETFIEGVYKIISAAHLQNKSHIIPEHTFYMEVLTQVVLWFSTKYLYIFPCFFSLKGLWVFVTNGFCWGKFAFIFTISASTALILKIMSFGIQSTGVFKWPESLNWPFATSFEYLSWSRYALKKYKTY